MYWIAELQSQTVESCAIRRIRQDIGRMNSLSGEDSSLHCCAGSGGRPVRAGRAARTGAYERWIPVVPGIERRVHRPASLSCRNTTDNWDLRP